jgi:hypothetical protein
MSIPETDDIKAGIYVDKFDEGTDYLHIGFTTSILGDFIVNTTSIASNKNRLQYTNLIATPTINAKVIAGYRGEMGDPGDEAEGNEGGASTSGGNSAVLKTVLSLWAWNSTIKYDALWPTFFNGALYVANPNSLPYMGESPLLGPSKWIRITPATSTKDHGVTIDSAGEMIVPLLKKILENTADDLEIDVETGTVTSPKKLDKAGGTMTGVLTAQSNTSLAAQVRNIQAGTAALTEGTSALTSGYIDAMYA